MLSRRLHALVLGAELSDAALEEAYLRIVGPLEPADEPADITYRLRLVDAVPDAPAGDPDFTAGDFLAYWVQPGRAVAHFPKFGRVEMELGGGVSEARIVSAAIDTYGVLEDLVAIGYSPHLRRRGAFLIHAFAAAKDDRCALIVGGIGAGKTTTGLSLLDAGWRLLSNDSPIMCEGGRVLSYPGPVAAFPESVAHFPSTRALSGAAPEHAEGRRKITFAAESVWPEVWQREAPIGAIIFPRIEHLEAHRLEPMGQGEALAALLPHAIEQWDREMIPSHLKILKELVAAAPAYILHLSADVLAIPDVITGAAFSP